MIFLVLSGKVLFLFPENMILLFRHKKKDDLSQKNTGNMIFSSDVLKRWSFQKIHAWTWSFFVISGKMVFLFSRKYYIFCLGGNWKKMIFIKKRVEIWYFLHVCVAYQAWHYPPGRKTKMPPKNTPKGDISGINKKDDIHPRFALDSSYFCWDTTFIDALERAVQAATWDVFAKIHRERPVLGPLF